MKVALFGRGKTGSKVQALLTSDNVIGPYGKNLPSVESLSDAQVAIVFVPADGIEPIIDLLLKARLPAIIGTTGYNISAQLSDKLRVQKLTWVWSSNFSIGVHLMKTLAIELEKLSHILPQSELNLVDIHHAQKVDAPSGTAKLINSWLTHPCPISSSRTGDEIGTHVLELSNANEQLSITHKALNRTVFASGARWAAQTIFKNNHLNGLYSFEELLQMKMVNNLGQAT